MSRTFTLALAAVAVSALALSSAAQAKPIAGEKLMFKPVPMKPVGPIANPVKPMFPKPIGPLANPVKPVKPIGPLVGPLKPLGPKPWPPVKPPKDKDKHHHHVKVIYVGGQAIYQPIAVPVAARPVAAVSSMPKRPCLTKDYTKEGLIIFRDLCTNETATSVVPGSAAALALDAAKAAEAQKQTTPDASQAEKQSSETTGSADFAGKSYQEFMASTQGPDQPAQAK